MPLKYPATRQPKPWCCPPRGGQPPSSASGEKSSDRPRWCVCIQVGSQPVAKQCGGSALSDESPGHGVASADVVHSRQWEETEAIAPAGGIRASIDDMARLVQTLIDGSAPGIAALDP